MNTNDEQIETLDAIDNNYGNDLDSLNNTSITSDSVKPQPISIEQLANSVSPTDLQNTDISNFGQEGIPLNNINQNPKPSTLETVPKSGEYNNIGMVPPNAHVENVPKKNNKKLFIVIIVAFVLVLGVGVFIYIYLNQGNKNVKNLILKDVSIQVGDKLSTNVNDYVERGNVELSSCLLNTDGVLYNRIGQYKYKVICGNSTFTGNVMVTDSILPVVVAQNVLKKANEELKIEEFIVDCNDASTCHFSYADEAKVNEYIKNSGTYEIIINVSDDYDNKVEVSAYLIVLANDITHNLVCESSSLTPTDSKFTYIVTDKIGLFSSGGFVFGNYATRDYVLNFSDKTNYEEIKNLIKDDGTLQVTNIIGKATYFDDEMVIKVNRLLLLDDLNNEFSNFPSSHSDIRNLYQNDERNFVCKADKVN